MPRETRRNSATFNASSSAAIWWLTADWVIPSSSAARRKLWCRAAASKLRKAVMDGIWRLDMPFLIHEPNSSIYEKASLVGLAIGQDYRRKSAHCEDLSHE